MESFFIDFGLSWVISKVLPYVFMLIIGVSIQLLMRRVIKRRSINRLLFVWLITFVPFIIYFALFPIYQGDFSNSYQLKKDLLTHEDIDQYDLVVVTIPNCPYCEESIGVVKKMKKRVPNLKIKYLVCSSKAASLVRFKKMIDDNFEVELANNKDLLAKYVAFNFPSFIRVRDDKMAFWTNDNFGVPARDFIEKSR